MKPPPRLAPDWPLPRYAFVPGRTPHPFSHPAGHRYGEGLVVAAPLPADFSDAFRLGLDLFHHGYYWEAHEMWEKLWHAEGRIGPSADFFKALIHLAAAGVKAREGVARGIVDHARRAESLFSSLLERGILVLGGLPISDCVAASQRASQCEPAPARDEAAQIVFEFVLTPE